VDGPIIFRSYSNTSEYFLRDYVTIAREILRFVQDNMLFSRKDMFMCENSPGIRISLVFMQGAVLLMYKTDVD